MNFKSTGKKHPLLAVLEICWLQCFQKLYDMDKVVTE